MGRPRKNPLIPTEGVLPLEENPFNKTLETQQNNNMSETNTPSFELDEKGLVKGVEYFFKDNNRRVDWRKMARVHFKEYIVPNKAAFPKDTDFSQIDVDDLPDEKILIKLGGWEAIADLRGFESIDYDAFSANRDFVSLKCTIVWSGNFETNFKEKVCSGTADTHPDTLKSFAVNFPTAICENRSFGRAVRKFLRIPILSQDELDKEGKAIPENEESPSVSGGISPKSALVSTMARGNVTFEQIKRAYIKEGSKEDSTPEQIAWKEKAENWTDESSPAPMDIFVIIKRLNDRIKAKEQKNPIPE